MQSLLTPQLTLGLVNQVLYGSISVVWRSAQDLSMPTLLLTTIASFQANYPLVADEAAAQLVHHLLPSRCH